MKFFQYRTPLVAQIIKNLPAVQETRVRFVGWEDPLEKEMAPHSSYSCLENPMDGGAWRAEVHGVSKSWTRLSDLTHTLSIQLWFWAVSLQCINCYGFIIMCFNMIQYCSCSVSRLCQTLLDPMNCSTPGFPALHCLLEFAQTHVHWVDDAIQPSHPLLPSSPSPPALNSQHQGLFQWVSSSHQMAKVLKLQLHHQSFQWILRVDFL